MLMSTRRCAQRQFLLRPSQATNELFRYVLAVSAQQHGIALHACVALSDHYHIAATDPHGRFPAFQQHMNSLLARNLNRRLRRRESFWAPGSYNAVTLVTPEDAFAKIVYILANPVSAALVECASEWPGVWTPPELIGTGPLAVRRPDDFFLDDGPMPDSAMLDFVPLPGHDAEGFRRRLSGALAQREEEVSRELARDGRMFMGAARVLAQDPFARAVTPEAARRLRPRIACLNLESRKEAIARLRSFLAEYHAAWLAFARGMRETVFPHGTYWMKVAYRVRCAASG